MKKMSCCTINLQQFILFGAPVGARFVTTTFVGVKDERVIQWIKRYLKIGVMENGVVTETEEGSP